MSVLHLLLFEYIFPTKYVLYLAVLYAIGKQVHALLKHVFDFCTEHKFSPKFKLCNFKCLNAISDKFFYESKLVITAAEMTHNINAAFGEDFAKERTIRR